MAEGEWSDRTTTAGLTAFVCTAGLSNLRPSVTYHVAQVGQPALQRHDKFGISRLSSTLSIYSNVVAYQIASQAVERRECSR